MANTSNLNLEKPLGTDQALVSVINSNSDKIDSWAGTTNQALSDLTDQQFSSFSAIPLTFRGACVVTSGSSVSDPNSPYPSSTVYWWNVIQIGIHSRLTQIATQAFDGNPGKDELWIRSRHRDDLDITQGWSSWRKLQIETPTNVSVSFNTTSLTMVSDDVLKIGRVVYIQVRFTTKTDVPAGTILATNFPWVLSDVASDAYAVSLYDRDNIGFVIRKDGSMFATRNLTINTSYIVTGSYVTAS